MQASEWIKNNMVQCDRRHAINNEICGKLMTLCRSQILEKCSVCNRKILSKEELFACDESHCGSSVAGTICFKNCIKTKTNDELHGFCRKFSDSTKSDKVIEELMTDNGKLQFYCYQYRDLLVESLYKTPLPPCKVQDEQKHEFGENEIISSKPLQSMKTVIATSKQQIISSKYSYNNNQHINDNNNPLLIEQTEDKKNKQQQSAVFALTNQSPVIRAPPRQAGSTYCYNKFRAAPPPPPLSAKITNQKHARPPPPDRDALKKSKQDKKKNKKSQLGNLLGKIRNIKQRKLKK